MERQLSSSQRDKLLFDESKEDSQFKRGITEAIRESNQTFAQSMQQMSRSIMFIAQGLGRSMKMIDNALATSNNANSQNPNFSQNTFTRNIPPAPNNVQYSQGAHQFQSSYGIFTSSNYNLDDNAEMPVSEKKTYTNLD